MIEYLISSRATIILWTSLAVALQSGSSLTR